MTERRRRRPLILTLSLVALVLTSGWTQASTSADGADLGPARIVPTAARAALHAAPPAPTAAGGAAALRSDAAAARRETGNPALVAHRALAVVTIGVGTALHVREQARALAAATAAEAERREAAALTAGYSGRNRFWIPSLGSSREVHLFHCTRKREPDHYMYRWGCAGENNVYILGHASSVMKPLHDLFVRGDLEVGMVAIYADDKGHV